MSKEQLEQRIDAIKSILAENSMPSYAPPQILAVTKTVEAQEILPLLEFGISDIGENRVQEIMRKAPDLSGKFRIHMIGRLQSNKVKYIIDIVNSIQSLDRISLAKEISLQGEKNGIVMPVLIQVNIAGEKQKGGLPAAEVEEFIEAVKGFSGLSIQGLMAMMPMTNQTEELRPYFKGMRQLFDRLKEKKIPHVNMERLSMGMSGDYPIAAAEGATMVRIGSAIFK